MTILASAGRGAGSNAVWGKGFEAFKNFGQQIIGMTEANRKTVGEATTVATRHAK